MKRSEVLKIKNHILAFILSMKQEVKNACNASQCNAVQ